MQMNEIVGQAQQLQRLPNMDEAPIARRGTQANRAKRPDAGSSTPVATQPPDIAFEPGRHPRRYGSGF